MVRLLILKRADSGKARGEIAEQRQAHTSRTRFGGERVYKGMEQFTGRVETPEGVVLLLSTWPWSSGFLSRAGFVVASVLLGLMVVLDALRGHWDKLPVVLMMLLALGLMAVFFTLGGVVSGVDRRRQHALKGVWFNRASLLRQREVRAFESFDLRGQGSRWYVYGKLEKSLIPGGRKVLLSVATTRRDAEFLADTFEAFVPFERPKE